MTEREKFMARLAEARDAGLVDVKFFFHPARATEPEEIFASLNQVEDAIRKGRCVRHTDWHGDHPAGVVEHA